MRPAAIWDASKRSRPDWPGSRKKSKIKAQAARPTTPQGDRKLTSWRSFGCPNGSRGGRFVGDREVFLSVGSSSDPPDTLGVCEILGSMTCRSQKNIKSSRLRSGLLAQGTRGSEGPAACVASGSAKLSAGKEFFPGPEGTFLWRPMPQRPRKIVLHEALSRAVIFQRKLQVVLLCSD